MDIKCATCGKTIVHQCHDDFREALKSLMAWVPEYAHPEAVAGIRKAGVDEGWLTQGEVFENQPFFGSQAWSYAMFGKDNARTFHALLNNVMRAGGVWPYDLEEPENEGKKP